MPRERTGSPPADGSVPEQDSLGELIRLAGPRPTAGAERSARVKENVRAHWRREARARRARRIAWSAAAVAAALLVVAGVSIARLDRSVSPAGETAASGPLARVAAARGPSWIHRNGSTASERGLPLHEGDPIPAGSMVSTGPDSGLALVDGEGRSIRLAGGSRIRYISSNAAALEEGVLYADAGRGEEPTLTIETAYGRVRDLGTQFEVSLSDGSIRIRVREGSVTLESPERTHEIAAGMQLAWSGRGEASYEEAPVFGSSWRWAERIAPLRDLRGRSAREFLDWLARERGWSLRFRTPEAEQAAGTITLSGSIQGLDLEEALDAVLPTCGMASEVHEGVLTVSRTDSGELGA